MQTQSKNGRGKKTSKKSAGGASPVTAGPDIIDVVKGGLSGIHNLSDVKERVDMARGMIETTIQEKPIQTLGAALGVGIGIGILLRRGMVGAIVAAAASMAVRRFAAMSIGASGAGIFGEDDGDDETN